MPRTDDVARKVRDGERLSPEEGALLLREGDFLELGALADTVRWRKHPERPLGRRWPAHRRPESLGWCSLQPL